MSYEIVWTYDVASARREAFERAYGADGDWARLFARGDGFLEVVLLADAAVPGRYLTIDRWRDAASFERFQAEHGDAYAALDDDLANVSGRGTRVGGFVRR
ncbi:antibiotic biosynthesis monooxygenase [Agromyces sp. H66]|uniref:antibiotic biosynthesis monooxygenase family protein n=1 Tax=Agromyces sp. H66 TaxID=2529859 RepID=UPI0010AA2BD2|nr:antibiotic biosynthesis monooxygenase [Agromyces sp. H66]